MPVKRAAKKKAAKKKGGGGGGSAGSTVSHEKLVAQVRLLTRWIWALKGQAGVGGWRIDQVGNGGRPDPSGGPPGI